MERTETAAENWNYDGANRNRPALQQANWNCDGTNRNCDGEPKLKRGTETATGRTGAATDGPALARDESEQTDTATGELELRRDELELRRRARTATG